MGRPINLIPARSVDGYDGYFVELDGAQVGLLWLPKGTRGRFYTAQAYRSERDTVRVSSLGLALDHIIHRARDL